MPAETLASHFEPIAISDQSTVVAEFTPEPAAQSQYQSEAELERHLIALLKEQAYEHLPITTDADLVANLRAQLEALNGISFSDSEWERFFTHRIAASNEGIVEKTRRIQSDHVQLLERDDGSVKNVRLIDKKNVHNNRLQVINQYEVEGSHANRYDVTVLVNGLPLVHIELKRRGVDIREAFNQIGRYQRESFWADSGLFEYVQLFVISNGTLTKYYSNTTRELHVEERSRAGASKKQTSNSFEFTSWWADATNSAITDLTGFTRTFFAKHAILNILTRYCVFDSEDKLLVMRPYQIVATERILQRIVTATNHKQLGGVEAGGYVWHTTGSGKTLTSFKTAQLATGLEGVEKVIFVVDRKDLDYQTMREYDRFEKGAANSNKSTKILKGQLEDPEARIIVTTIQKLSIFIEQNKGHEVFSGHIVLIFDECHRSQFGDMRAAVGKAFKKYNLFGFTGTPIFAENAASGGNPQLRTTEQAFGEKLHTYTVVDAITDKNVLPFRVDYVNTIKANPLMVDKEVAGIERESALLAPERLTGITNYILDHFAQKTKQSAGYRLGERRLFGFNSIFATASIDAAKRYYESFTREQARRAEADPTYRPLTVGIIYSYAANEELEGGILGEEGFETEALDQSSRDFLEGAIADYNAMFKQNYDTSSDGFQNYYRDLSMRIKNREIDIVIVVNMFLTGFDATTLNTLWVDKNLRQHGLIQAYSRTNRILNSVKTFGNIVSFRDLEEETNDALALFGNKDARGVVLLRPYREYLEEHDAKLADLIAQFPPGEAIIGEQAQKDFVVLFGAILRLRNILNSFDDFEDDDRFKPFDLQNYKSLYLDIYAEFRKETGADRESIQEDVVFEIELIKSVEVNVDYILMLVARYLESKGQPRDKEILAEISRAVDASPSLRNKKDLVEQFVHDIGVGSDVHANWRRFIEARREEELSAIIAAENLRPQETARFIEGAFRDGAIPTSGTAITQIMPPVSKFAVGGDYAEKKRRALEKLFAFFERYFGLT
jgi:type I restriction enzyme R subunit